MADWLHWAWAWIYYVTYWGFAWFIYLVPLLLVVFFWWWFSRYMKTHQRYVARTVEHMEKMEALMGRVARAVESNRNG